MTVRVTDRGEVTLPKAVQDCLGIGPGSLVDFEPAPDGRIVLVKVDLTEMTNRLEKLRGSAGKGLSTDEIMELTRGGD
jgi:antitoxin PrlF